MRGCVGQGQPTAGAISQDHNNKAVFCFPLQFSHMDNRVAKRGCMCVGVCVCSSEDARSIINVSTETAEGRKSSHETIIFGAD